jgi:hypothetical protein
MIDNSKLVLELFNYKKGLSMDQVDVERVVNYHLGLFNCDETGKIPSQKQIISSLSEGLKKFSYDESVKALVESVQAAIENEELFYELDDLYRALENANQGMVYRHPMQVILNIINEGSDRDKQIRILNELSQYTWIPQVKNFMFKYTTKPSERANITSDGGRSQEVYSVVEKVQDGFLTFVGDKWFHLTEKSIEPSTPSNHINDAEALKKLGMLEKALRIGDIDGDRINFQIEEGLTLGVSFKNGDLFLNGEKCDKATTLESIFNSPIVPFMRHDMYPVILECVNGLEKFVELDIVQKVSNITNPFLECFAFNYKDAMYVYSMDKRYGNTFYEYDSATMLCNEMRSQLGFDMSDFFKNKFSQEVQVRHDLERREKVVLTKISEINENLSKLELCGLLEVNEQIKGAYTALKSEKDELEKEHITIKGAFLGNKNLK